MRRTGIYRVERPAPQPGEPSPRGAGWRPAGSLPS